MTTDYLTLTRDDPPIAAAAVIALIGLATICGFFFFQYVVGLAPCPLCLEQRNAYYVSVPLATLLWLGAAYGAQRKVLLLGFLAIAVAMLWNTGLSTYHAGIEWKWWPGPQECTGPMNNVSAAGDLLKQLNNFSPIRCDEAAWRFLGLSLAGWDVLVSLSLAIAALWGARACLARGRQSG
ncbi:MAG TPA: disulfide bond formation protein B [Pseudolabrys sp.]|nr:disulfide bond formation protein B [Pseudolabrys sp.]